MSNPAAARGLHYAWVVAAAAFLLLLTAAGIRAASSVIIVPLEREFGWTRAVISAAVAVSIFLYGFMGPFAAALTLTIGIKRTFLLAFAVLAAATGLSLTMSQPWHLIATWGVLIGIGAGTSALPLGTALVNRWFVAHRGLVTGLLTAAMAAGQLVFLPTLAYFGETGGWRVVVMIVCAISVAAVPLVLLLREHPADMDLPPLGGERIEQPPAPSGANPVVTAIRTLVEMRASRDFWLLGASFFVCGLSTSGLVQTHLIPYCVDNGITETRAAGLLAFIGIFNVIGTTLSGWLTDRYDSRWLLFWYYGLRGVSLVFLPFTGFDAVSLTAFAVFYGLDWIATVPPTVRLTSDIFGKAKAPVLFGWLMCIHQLGGAVAAFGAGSLRTALERYLESFMISGLACFVAALVVLAIGRVRRAPGAPAGAAA